MALMFDDGVEEHSGDTTWDDTSAIECVHCGKHGFVGNFTVENWPISASQPIKPGDRLYFADPDEAGDNDSSGWYRVVTAPEVKITRPLPDAEYNSLVVKLVSDEGRELEAFPHELSRKAPAVPPASD